MQVNSVQRVDVTAAAAKLRAAAQPSVSGHRHVALLKSGPLSVILFVFEQDGLLKEHQASGEVIIHVLAGQLSVAVAEDVFTLGPGELLSLAPGLRHSVRALAQSDMLLTISQIAPVS